MLCFPRFLDCATDQDRMPSRYSHLTLRQHERNELANAVGDAARPTPSAPADIRTRLSHGSATSVPRWNIGSRPSAATCWLPQELSGAQPITSQSGLALIMGRRFQPPIWTTHVTYFLATGYIPSSRQSSAQLCRGLGEEMKKQAAQRVRRTTAMTQREQVRSNHRPHGPQRLP